MNASTLLVISGIVSLVLAIPLARRSHQIEPVVSAPGQIFHFLACAAMVAVPITVLLGLITGTGTDTFLLALALLAAAACLFLLHAIPEYQKNK